MKPSPLVKLPEARPMEAPHSGEEGESWQRAFQEMHEVFVRQFDRGRIIGMIDRLWDGEYGSQGPCRDWGHGVEMTGQGRSSSCFRVRGQTSSMDLAVKVLGRQVDDRREKVTLRQWEEDLRAITEGAIVPLVPPMRLLKGERAWALVMPFGSGGRASIGSKWMPIDAWVSAMTRSLQDRGLCLGDVPQVFAWRGIPFVVDFFDLGKR